MWEVRGLLQQIQHGVTGQRLGAMQKLLSLETDEYTGDQVEQQTVVVSDIPRRLARHRSLRAVIML